MCPEIQVDDEVYAFLQKHGTAFVDQPNDVLRRLLLQGRVALKTDASAPNSEMEGTPTRRAAAVSAGRVRNATGGKETRPKRSRAPSDALLPESEYEMPILFVLECAGGRAATSEVVAAVGKELSDKFLPMDREVMENGRQRWEMRTQFTRLRMVKAGLLEKNSPRGMWAISDAGRVRLSKDAVAV